MKRLVVVAVACAVIVASVLMRKSGGGSYNAVGVTVGIVVGTWYFLQAVVRGGGIAMARVTQDPGEPRKAGDPDGSIGMGLAASAIAAGVLGSPDYAPFRVYFAFFLGAGILIALGYAIKGVVIEARVRHGEAADKPGSAI